MYNPNSTFNTNKDLNTQNRYINIVKEISQGGKTKNFSKIEKKTVHIPLLQFQLQFIEILAILSKLQIEPRKKCGLCILCHHTLHQCTFPRERMCISEKYGDMACVETRTKIRHFYWTRVVLSIIMYFSFYCIFLFSFSFLSIQYHIRCILRIKFCIAYKRGPIYYY